MVKLLLRRPLATSNYVARGLRRICFTVARGSCDRHLCRKRPPATLKPVLKSQEASCDRKTSPQEPLATVKRVLRRPLATVELLLRRPLATTKRVRQRSFHRLLKGKNSLYRL